MLEPLPAGGPGRRLPRRGPVAARLRVQRQARRAGLGRGADRPRVGGADDPARLRPLRRAGRRLGDERQHAARRPRPRAPGRHPPRRRRSRRPTRRRSTTSRTPSAARSPTSSAAPEWESGYAREHATRPQTVGYALIDSPAGPRAWIAEKYCAWTDHDGGRRTPCRDDDARHADALLAHPAPARRRRGCTGRAPQVDEWIAGAAGAPRRRARPAARSSRARCTGRRAAGRRAASPTSATGASRRGAGTSPALEQPALLVDEVRAFFRLVR